MSRIRRPARTTSEPARSDDRARGGERVIERSRLLVIVSETVSDWMNKGEVVDRYYNPGDFFDEVHLVLTNDDHPADRPLQRMVGRARAEVHNFPLPASVFRRTLGYRPRLLRPWAEGIV